MAPICQPAFLKFLCQLSKNFYGPVLAIVRSAYFRGMPIQMTEVACRVDDVTDPLFQFLGAREAAVALALP